MPQTRIPAWWLALRPDDIDRVNQMFREFLRNVPLSHGKLADKIGVDQSTVSRWAAGKSNPSPDQMRAVITAIEEHIAEVQRHVQRTSQVLDAVEAATAIWRQHGAIPGVAAFKKQQAAAQNVHKLLEQR